MAPGAKTQPQSQPTTLLGSEFNLDADNSKLRGRARLHLRQMSAWTQVRQDDLHKETCNLCYQGKTCHYCGAFTILWLAGELAPDAHPTGPS